MKSGRLVVLLMSVTVAAIGLIRADALWPAALRFVDPLLADPQPTAPAAEHPLPDFVPNRQNLSFAPNADAEAASSSAEPDGAPTSTSKAAAAVDATPATAIQPPDKAAGLAAIAAPPSAPVAAQIGPTTTRTVSLTTEPIDPSQLPAAPPSGPQVIAAKTLFGAAKVASPLAARAIGTYARGCLSGAIALPVDGPAWQAMRLSRNRNWGHPNLIALVERFANDSQKLDGWPGLLVGDISQPRGGPMLSGHASHQIGLDADVWLTPMPDHRLTDKEREDISATSMLDSTEIAVDPKVFTPARIQLIKRAASYPQVERVLVHPAIKKALCMAAGTDRKWLGKVRPIFGHYYHMHIRIACPPGYAGCKPQTPPTGDDGCGKEVEQWLARVTPPKTPPQPAPPPPPGYKPKPPPAPMTLAQLPQECTAVLESGPNGVAIPAEAKRPATASKQIVRAAAAAPAAATAVKETVKVQTLTATPDPAVAAARASPALRPHLRKVLSAEQKATP